MMNKCYFNQLLLLTCVSVKSCVDKRTSMCIFRLSLLPRAQSAVNKIRGTLSEFGYKVSKKLYL